MFSYRHPSPGASAVQESLGSSLCSAQWTQYHKACERRKRNGPILNFKAFANLYEDKKKKKEEKEETSTTTTKNNTNTNYRPTRRLILLL